MAFRFRLLFIAAVVAGKIVAGHYASPQEQTPSEPSAALDRVFAIHQQIKDVHPAFNRLYPVAVVRGGMFYVYEPDPGTGHYNLAATAPDTFNVPAGVRAAMPLGFLGNRIACVVTPDAFEDLGGFILVFHEFVHCYQWESCEMRLKEKMEVYRAAMKRKDYMWELQYAFPYGAEDFRQNYETMLAALDKGDARASAAVRAKLKERLSSDDWEYMTWQEWKEGLARYLENVIAARLGRPANHGGIRPPFTRVTFYAGGEALIRELADRKPGILKDIEALYHQIAEP